MRAVSKGAQRCPGGQWGRMSPRCLQVAGQEITVARFHWSERASVRYSGCLWHFNNTLLKFSPLSFSDAIFPGSPFSDFSLFAHSMSKWDQATLERDLSPLIPHTLPGCSRPCHDFSMDDDTESRLMTPRSLLQLRLLQWSQDSTSQVSLKCLKEIPNALWPRQDSQWPSPTLLPAANIPLPTHPPWHHDLPSSARCLVDYSCPLTAQHHKHLGSRLAVLQDPTLNISQPCLILSIPCLT